MAGCHLHGALQDTDSLEDALFLLGAHLFSDKWRMTNCLYQLSDLSHYDSRHRLSCFKNVQIIRTGSEELDTVICFCDPQAALCNSLGFALQKRGLTNEEVLRPKFGQPDLKTHFDAGPLAETFIRVGKLSMRTLHDPPTSR